MSSYAHLGLLVLLVIIPASTGYGGGAPTSACVNMTPNHTDAVVQQSASPFSLKVTGDLTTATDTLKVCVTGKTFKGILLQMRVVGHTLPIGTFNGTKRTLANDTKLMNCSAVGDTVTHSKPSSKSSGTCFIWISPDSDIPNNVHFVATIVENLTLYWVNVTSDVINPPLVISTSGPQDITTATSDAITTNTTSMRDDIPTTTSRDSGAIAPGVAFTTCAVCSLLAIVVRLLH